jgi:hypothetical protein
VQLAAFEMGINYTQVAIHRPDAPDFFEHWTQADGERGFIARDGHVVFGVEDHDGTGHFVVRLEQAPGAGLATDFDVRDGGVVVATPVGIDHAIAVPPGRYGLSFAATPRAGEGLDVVITFWPRGA